MKIKFNKVTWYSQIAAIIVFVGVFFLGFYLGGKFESVKPDPDLIASAKFICKDDKIIQADFYDRRVELTLSDGRKYSLYQTISASGARYANVDESFVFWNKGDTAFIQENDTASFEDCVVEE